MVRRNILPLTILAIGLLITSFADIQTVNASPGVMVDLPWGRVTGINQPVEFTASGNGGTPPYTFQWYTTFLDPSVPPEQWITVAVPGVNSATFKFVESVPGRYGISIRLTDSKGDDEYQSFQPMGIVVTVQSTPVIQPTLSPSPTPQEPTVSFTLWHTASPVIQTPADRLAHIPAVIEIDSPQNQTELQTSSIALKVNVVSYFWVIDYVYYETDWQDGRHQIFGVQPNYTDALNASITVNFNEIPNGNHNITVYTTTNDGCHSLASVSFATYAFSMVTPSTSPTLSPPNISYLLKQNKTYIQNTVPLNFSLSQPAEWIAYSLDGQAAVSISGNTTLRGLSNGYHTVTIYANDIYGNAVAPQTITFTVNVPMLFSSIEASVAISIVMAFIAVAIVLIKKRRHA